MPSKQEGRRPPVCDYEGSDYQQRFWEAGERHYEDQVEAIAIRRLLPKSGKLLLEVGAGAGRNTERYGGYDRIVLMDYSRTQLEQAQARLGNDDRYIYVAADVYRLPFVDGLFDGATMIRVLHHMADAPAALAQIRQTLAPEAVFLLEYANKLNLKAIGRYLLRRQDWNPLDRQPVEFIDLNFNFHPAAVRGWLRGQGFSIQRQLTVSHFRLGVLKRKLPTRWLVALDSLFQPTGNLWQLTPSVFVRAEADDSIAAASPGAFFKCPECGQPLPNEEQGLLSCANCGSKWGRKNGIYDFKQAVNA